MKNIFYILIAAFSLILHAKCVGQNNIVYGAGISYTNGVPTFVPPSKSARVAIDTVTSKWYEYATPGGWRWSGDRVQDISGCAAPAYVPGKAQSCLALNSCTEAQNGHGPELYKYTGSAWLCLNCGGIYTAGDGIDIIGSVITNTAPDQVVTISGATGSYPNFTIPSPAVTLNDLTDVTLSTPTNTQVLQYNSATTQWVNATLSGITGTGVLNRVPIFSGTNTVTTQPYYAITYSDADAISQSIGSYSYYGQIPAFVAPYMGQNARVIDATGAVRVQVASFPPSMIAMTDAGGFSYYGSPTNLAANTNIFTNTYLMFRVTKTGQITAGTASPNAAAKIDITSTTQGILFPRMTATQRDAIASPPDGLVLYNTTAAKLQVRAAGAWVDLH